MRGLAMMMVMHVQVAHIGRYSMTEGGECQEGRTEVQKVGFSS